MTSSSVAKLFPLAWQQEASRVDEDENVLRLVLTVCVRRRACTHVRINLHVVLTSTLENVELGKRRQELKSEK